MKRALVSFGVLLALGLVESLLARQLPFPLVIQLVVPYVLALAFFATPKTYRRGVIGAGIVKELGSGLPFGVALLSTVAVLALFRAALFKKARLPWFTQGAGGAFALCVLLSWYFLLARGTFSFTVGILPALLLKVITPSLIGGLLIAAYARLRAPDLLGGLPFPGFPRVPPSAGRVGGSPGFPRAPQARGEWVGYPGSPRVPPTSGEV